MPPLSRAASSEFRAWPWPWHVPGSAQRSSARITGEVRPQQTTVRVGPGRLDLVTRPDPSATRRPPPTAAAGCRRAPPRRRTEAFRGVPRGSEGFRGVQRGSEGFRGRTPPDRTRTRPGDGAGSPADPHGPPSAGSPPTGRSRTTRRPWTPPRGRAPPGQFAVSIAGADHVENFSRPLPGVDRGSPPCRSQLVVGRPDASPAGPPCRYGRMPVKACGAQSRAKETSVSQRVKPRRSYTAMARTLDSSTYSIA